MTLGKKSITLDAGKTSTLSVKTENTTETPSFKSSNTKVATVNKTTGKITAKAEGTTTITVTCGSLTETCKVTVKPVVTVSSSKLTAYKGVSTTLKATVKGSSKAPTFKSSNTKVLTVNKTTGKITPKAARKNNNHSNMRFCKNNLHSNYQKPNSDPDKIFRIYQREENNHYQGQSYTFKDYQIQIQQHKSCNCKLQRCCKGNQKR